MVQCQNQRGAGQQPHCSGLRKFGLVALLAVLSLTGCDNSEAYRACCDCLATRSHNTFGAPIPCLTGMSAARCAEALGKGGQIYFQMPCLNTCSSQCAGVIQTR